MLGIAAVMGGDKMLDWITEPYQHEGMSLTYAHELFLNFGTMFLHLHGLPRRTGAAAARSRGI